MDIRGNVDSEDINNSIEESLSNDSITFAEAFPVMILECNQCGEIIFASSSTRQFLDLPPHDSYPSLFDIISKIENNNDGWIQSI